MRGYGEVTLICFKFGETRDPIELRSIVKQEQNVLQTPEQSIAGVGHNGYKEKLLRFSAVVHKLFWLMVVALFGSVAVSVVAVVAESRPTAIVATGLLVIGFVSGVSWLEHANVERQSTQNC